MLQEKLNQDLKQAMRDKETLKLSVIRMALTVITNKEKEKKQVGLSDPDVISILQTMIKQRVDSAEQFTKGGRDILAKQEQDEIEIIKTYLPQEAPLLQIQSTAQIVHTNWPTQPPTQKDMGAMIKSVKETIDQTGFRADGKIVSDEVKKLIQT